MLLPSKSSSPLPIIVGILSALYIMAHVLLVLVLTDHLMRHKHALHDVAMVRTLHCFAGSEYFHCKIV